MKARVPQQNNTAGMLKQVQKMQEDMQAKQAELEAAEYDVSAGGGMVKVKINGKREILSMEIAPDIIDPDDPETLSDVVIAAVNEAIKLVDKTSEEEMAKITGALGGLGMGGLF